MGGADYVRWRAVGNAPAACVGFKSFFSEGSKRGFKGRLGPGL